MFNARNGQRVKNSRTGDTGVFQGFKTDWNGRNDIKKAVVLLQGDTKPKIWALSSCNIVEDEAPRALVSLKELLSTMCKPHMSSIIAEFKNLYTNIEVGKVARYILEDDCITAYINNVERFKGGIDQKVFGRLICFIQLEFASGRIAPTFAGGVSAFTLELINLYYGKKPQ